MGRLLIIFLFLAGSVRADAQKRIASPATSVEKTTVIQPDQLSFDESEFDFGKIPQGKPVTHVFTFRNTGKTPIVLSDVHASCGCTTPEWNRDTIPAGGSASIKVGYNSAAEGVFVKPVTVSYNGGQTKQLIIKGEVWQTPVNSAPQNHLVNQLNRNQSL